MDNVCQSCNCSDIEYIFKRCNLSPQKISGGTSLSVTLDFFVSVPQTLLNFTILNILEIVNSGTYVNNMNEYIHFQDVP